MKAEYVTSSLGTGTELHISSAEYKRINNEDGWNDHPNLMFAVISYTSANRCTNSIKNRDLEEAFRHIKKAGTIVLATKTDAETAWCEVYAITEGEIIPVITSNDGSDFNINYSGKTKRERNKTRKERDHE